MSDDGEGEPEPAKSSGDDQRFVLLVLASGAEAPSDPLHVVAEAATHKA